MTISLFLFLRRSQRRLQRVTRNKACGKLNSARLDKLPKSGRSEHSRDSRSENGDHHGKIPYGGGVLLPPPCVIRFDRRASHARVRLIKWNCPSETRQDGPSARDRQTRGMVGQVAANRHELLCETVSPCPLPLPSSVPAEGERSRRR